MALLKISRVALLAVISFEKRFSFAQSSVELAASGVQCLTWRRLKRSNDVINLWDFVNKPESYATELTLNPTRCAYSRRNVICFEVRAILSDFCFNVKYGVYFAACSIPVTSDNSRETLVFKGAGPCLRNR